jgi:hypothetical protein
LSWRWVSLTWQVVARNSSGRWIALAPSVDKPKYRGAVKSRKLALDLIGAAIWLLLLWPLSSSWRF